MNSNLESKMFQAGATARLNAMVKEAGIGSVGNWAKGLGRGVIDAPKNFRSGIGASVRGESGSEMYQNAGKAFRVGNYVGANPIKSTLGAAGLAGAAGAGTGILGTSAIMNSKFNNEMAGMDASLKKTLEGYAGSQTWTDKLRDLFAYMFNGKALAGNKYNDIMNYASANKANFSPFMQKKLQPRFDAAAASPAPAAVKAN